MQLNKNHLFMCMALIYLIPVGIIIYYYQNNMSLSNIICKDDVKNIIFVTMLIFGLATLIYEYQRNDLLSLMIVFFLLISIFALIYVKETLDLHYVFAFCAFLSIICFMTYHCYFCQHENLLYISLFFQVCIFLLLAKNINNNKNIFFYEILFLLNFAIFYIVLHFTNW
jgi:hypothetical protein